MHSFGVGKALSAREIPVGVATQLLLRKNSDGHSGISPAKFLGQGKTYLTLPPCIWRANCQGCGLLPQVRVGLLLCVCLGKTAEVSGQS